MDIELKNLTPKQLKAVTAAYDYHDDPLAAFETDAKTYVEALREGRLLLQVTQVSKSGLTRFVSVRSCEKDSGFRRYFYRSYFAFMTCLGHIYSPRHDGFKIQGAGMNMIFALNYDLVHDLHGLGLVDSTELVALSQKIS